MVRCSMRASALGRSSMARGVKTNAKDLGTTEIAEETQIEDAGRSRREKALRIDRPLSRFYLSGIAHWACEKHRPGRDLRVEAGSPSGRGQRRRMRKASSHSGGRRGLESSKRG